MRRIIPLTVAAAHVGVTRPGVCVGITHRAREVVGQDALSGDGVVVAVDHTGRLIEQAVGTWVRAEVLVEAAVLFEDDHDVLNALEGTLGLRLGSAELATDQQSCGQQGGRANGDEPASLASVAPHRHRELHACAPLR